MKYSNKLDLNKFFYVLRKQPYVIVKLGDFPNYYTRSDIDIFCYNKDDLVKRIIAVGKEYVKKGFEIKVFERTDSHVHLDFYFKDKLDFRFDIHDALPPYKRVRIKKHYLYSIVENAKKVYKNYKKKKYPIFVPCKTDELLIRYIEYIEYYRQREDKINHLDYILGELSKNSKRINFLDKLHLYTALPKIERQPVQKKKLRKKISDFLYLYKIRIFRILGKLNNFIFKFFENKLRKYFLLTEPEKRKLVKEYAKRFNIKIFVETGTNKGNMIAANLDVFEKIYSIELDKKFYRIAKKRFLKNKKVDLILGESTKKLPEVLEKISEPALFWLDAHFANFSPVMQELKHIFNHKIKNHVILIDDARIFKKRKGTPSLKKIKSYVLEKRPDWNFEIKKDIIRIYSNRIYSKK